MRELLFMKITGLFNKSLLSLSLISTFALVGCGQSSSEEETANNTSSEETSEEVDPTTLDEDVIVIYSNAASDGRGEWFKEQAAEAGFEIEFVSLGGTDVLNRLVAEKNAPIADVVFGLNQMNFTTLADEELLEPYEPNWLGEVDDSVEINSENLYSPIDIARVFPIYNADVLSEDEVPKSWAEFYENDKFHDKYKVQDKLGGATDTAAMYIHLLGHKDENADMGIDEEGWENLNSWFENGYSTPEGEDWVQNFVDGEIPLAYTYMAKPAEIEEEYGVNVGIIDPEEGAIQTVEQIGIVADGDDNTKEQEFIDWFGSAEVMAGFAENHNQMPVNTEAQESAPEGLVDVMENTTPAEIDFDFVGEHLDEWIEFVELNIL